MIFIKRLREEKDVKCRVIAALVFLGVCTPIFIGCMVYYFRERSHYGETVCRIANCSISYTNVCIHGMAFYSCYSGFFDYYSTWLDGNYIKKGNVFMDEDSSFYYNCINNGSLFCTFDDRDIQSSLSLGSQPSLFGIIFINLISGFLIVIGLIILLVFIVFTLCLANLKDQLQQNAANLNQPEVMEHESREMA